MMIFHYKWWANDFNMFSSQIRNVDPLWGVSSNPHPLSGRGWKDSTIVSWPCLWWDSGICRFCWLLVSESFDYSNHLPEYTWNAHIYHWHSFNMCNFPQISSRLVARNWMWTILTAETHLAVTNLLSSLRVCKPTNSGIWSRDSLKILTFWGSLRVFFKGNYFRVAICSQCSPASSGRHIQAPIARGPAGRHGKLRGPRWQRWRLKMLKEIEGIAGNQFLPVVG